MTVLWERAALDRRTSSYFVAPDRAVPLDLSPWSTFGRLLLEARKTGIEHDLNEAMRIDRAGSEERSVRGGLCASTLRTAFDLMPADVSTPASQSMSRASASSSSWMTPQATPKKLAAAGTGGQARQLKVMIAARNCAASDLWASFKRPNWGARVCCGGVFDFRCDAGILCKGQMPAGVSFSFCCNLFRHVAWSLPVAPQFVSCSSLETQGWLTLISA